MAAWWEDTTPQQRGPLVAGIVTLGLLTPPVMITTVAILVVLVSRLRRRRRIGIYQRGVLAGLFGVHLAFWLARWALLSTPAVDRDLGRGGGGRGAATV